MFKHLDGGIEIWHYFAPRNMGRGKARIVESNMEEIEVIVAGHGNFELGNETVVAGPGSNVWYSPGDSVCVTSDNSDPYETIVFRFGLKYPQKTNPAQFSRWGSVAQCKEFCNRVLALYQSNGLDDEDVECCYARLVWELRESRRRQAVELLPESLTVAMEFVQKNFTENLSVAWLADVAGISSPHLQLLFRTHLSISPMQYVIRQRILAAQEMLLRTNHSVKEICHEVGFNDLKYFCSRFKRQTSYRPTEYRQLFIS